MITTAKELDEIDKKLIKLAAEGMTAKEIAYELNLKHRSVDARFREMKKYFECKSITHLVVTLNGKIIQDE